MDTPQNQVNAQPQAGMYQGISVGQTISGGLGDYAQLQQEQTAAQYLDDARKSIEAALRIINRVK